MDLMMAFSDIVLTQFRILVKEVIAQADDELPALAARRNDRFFTSHIHDVLRELQSASLSIQSSFCSQLSRNFIAFVYQDPTWAAYPSTQRVVALDGVSALIVHDFHGGCAPRLRELASRVRGLDSVSPPPAATVPLLIAPEDLILAFIRATHAIHLPIHADVQRCLAGLMAQKLAERAVNVYDQFSLVLEHAHCVARGSVHDAADSPAPPARAKAAVSLRHDGHDTLRLSAEVPATSAGMAQPTTCSSAIRKPALRTGIGRVASRLVRFAAEKLPALTIKPINLGRRFRQAAGADSHDPLGGSMAANVAFKRFGYTGAIYLVTVMLIFGVNQFRHAGAASGAGEPARGAAAVGPSSSSQPMRQGTEMNEISASVGRTERDGRPSPAARAAESDSLALHDPADTARNVSSPAEPRADTGITALRKVRLNNYDWERKRSDKTIRMWIRIFNGSNANVRNIRLDCASYSENLTHLQSFSKNLEQAIAPWTTATVRDVNVGNLHPKTARLRCHISGLDAFPTTDAH